MKKIKKETQKELGKYILDLTKIVFALVVITPFVKDDVIQIMPLMAVCISSTIGIWFINKGIKDE